MAEPAYSTNATAFSTRRQFLGALAFTPALAFPAVAAIPDRSEWDALVTAHEVSSEAYEAASDRLARRQKKWDAKRLPYPDVEIGGKTIRGDLAKFFFLGKKDAAEAKGHWRGPASPAARRALAAIRRVDLANARLSRSMGIPALKAEKERALNEQSTLFGRLTSYPVDTLALLVAKIDYLEADGGAAEFGDEIIADVRRIAARAAN